LAIHLLKPWPVVQRCFIECDEYINNPHNYNEIANKMLIVLSRETDRDYLRKRADRLMDIYSVEKAAAAYAGFLGIGEEK